jgi:antimicrobial peptide system SdpA family protein
MRSPFRAPARPATAPEDAALGGLVLLVALFWAAAVAYAIHPALPYNAVRLPFAAEMRRVVLAPQGWAFFTRDPREEKQTLFARGADRAWRSALLAPHARLANTLGLNRRSRSQGVEAAMLMEHAPDEAYVECREAPSACLLRLPAGVKVRNASSHPTLCGAVAVVLQPPVPWAWLGTRRPVVMPSRILPLEVSC